jgi:hypothetical protein
LHSEAKIYTHSRPTPRRSSLCHSPSQPPTPFGSRRAPKGAVYESKRVFEEFSSQKSRLGRKFVHPASAPVSGSTPDIVSQMLVSGATITLYETAVHPTCCRISFRHASRPSQEAFPGRSLDGMRILIKKKVHSSRLTHTPTYISNSPSSNVTRITHRRSGIMLYNSCATNGYSYPDGDAKSLILYSRTIHITNKLYHIYSPTDSIR